ncbi:MAG TPA: MFS transporter [Acetobacteraceae bacterium]|nr:MFS transporter [Acetobacteraceae bacterium]
MPRRRANVGFVLATLAIDALGFGIVVPIVPELVERLGGLSAAAASLWVGGLLAVFSATQFLAAPVLGGLSDRYGRRPVLLASLAGVCVNYLLLAWAPTLPWLFAGRLIAGATAANVSAATAYIADVTPPAQRAQRFGLVGGAFGFGFVLGPALGGLLGGVWLRLPFLAAAGLAFVNVLYGAFVLPESLPAERRRPLDWRRANPIGSLASLGSDPAAIRLAIAWCCAWFALGALQSSFVLSNGLRFGWGPRLNGIALALIGASTAVVQALLVRRVVGRLGERRAALAGYVLAAAAYASYAFAIGGWMIYLGLVLQALGAVSGPAVQAMVSQRAGADRQGETQGALSSLQGLTSIVAPLIAGWLFGVFAAGGAPVRFPGAPFLLAALSYGMAFVAVRGIPELRTGRPCGRDS